MKTLNLTRKDSKTAGKLSTALILIFDAINAPVQHKVLYQNNLFIGRLYLAKPKNLQSTCLAEAEDVLAPPRQLSRCRVVGKNPRSRRECWEHITISGAKTGELRCTLYIHASRKSGSTLPEAATVDIYLYIYIYLSPHTHTHVGGL